MRWLIAVVIVASAFLATPALSDTQAVADANAGLDALARNDFRSAEQLITKAINEGGLSPSDLELAYLTRAKAYVGEYRNDLASVDLAKATAIDPTDEEAAALRQKLAKVSASPDAGNAYCRSDISSDLAQADSQRTTDVSRSIASFSKIVAKCPNDARAHFGLGASYGYRAFFTNSTDDNLKALGEISIAVQFDPQNALYLMTRGNVNKNRGDCNAALADYDAALTVDTRNAELFVLYGNARISCGDMDGGLAEIRRGLAINPANFDGYWILANALARTGKCQEALPNYDAALKYVDQNAYSQNIPMLYNNRGACYRALGMKDQAIADFKRALEIDPSFTQASMNLAQTQ